MSDDGMRRAEKFFAKPETYDGAAEVLMPSDEGMMRVAEKLRSQAKEARELEALIKENEDDLVNGHHDRFGGEE